MSEELHIASLVVHALPARLPTVSRRITALPLACVHGASPAGKLVVTLEGDSAHHIVDQVGAIQHIPGVLNVALVYQHIEPVEHSEHIAARRLQPMTHKDPHHDPRSS